MTTSADPGKLLEFTNGVKTARTSAETQRTTVATRLVDTIAACDGYVGVPAVGALHTLLESMGENETFVSTIRAELLAADTGEGGPITISDAAVASALASRGVGTPPAPIEFDPLTIVGIPQTSGFVDDPICAANGNMIHQDKDLEFPAIAGALDLVRTYNSLLHDRIGAFGPGWSSVLDVTLASADQRIEVQLPDGAIITATRSGDGWTPNSRRVRRVEEAGGGFVVHLDHERRFHFDAGGLLTGWDTTAGSVDVERTEGRLTGARETRSGRRIDLRWDGDVIASITTGDGRTVDYRRDTEGRILTVATGCGTLRYTWDGGLLLAVTDDDGVAAFTNVYDDEGRVIEQTSPFGRVTSYSYDAAGVTVISDQQGVRQAMVHDGRGNLTSVIDIDGSAMRITYDDADRAVRIVSKSGAEWRHDFDPVTGDLVRRHDPDGFVQSWTWDDQGRVLTDTARSGAVTTFEYDAVHRSPVRIVGPDGGIVVSELDEAGRPVSITDADGIVTRLHWDADGQLTGVTDAAGSRTTFEFDTAGLISRIIDPLGADTRLEYEFGRVVRSRRGDSLTAYERTAAGRITGGVEPGEVAWSATFGDHGAVDSITDAVGSTVRFEYDVLGDVTAVVAPDGAIYRSEFDVLGRLVAAVDPTGARSEMAYDSDGNLIAITDPDGRTMRRTVDELGRTVESIAADGAVTRWTYHPDGQVATVSVADGRTWSTEIDTAGRLVAVIDPTGGRATRTYSPGGRLQSRTSPAGRTERFEYDDAGRCVALVGVDGIRRDLALDASGQVTGIDTSVADAAAHPGVDAGVGDHLDVVWDDQGRIVGYRSASGESSVERDPAGRIRATTDATGATTRYEWDERGLLSASVDPAGITSSYRYDERGRLVDQSAPAGRSTRWQYDVAGYIATVGDPAGVVTEILRDRSGIVTGVRRDGHGWDRTLDAGGRESERRALDGTVLGRYGYDAAGRLTSASVPDSGFVSAFLWDDNDRLSQFTDVTGTSTIERDADGLAVAFTNQDGVRTVVERDTFGRVVGLRDGEAGEYRSVDDEFIRDPAGRLLIGPDATVYRYDDAGRLAEIAPPDEVATRYDYGDDGLIARETGPNGTRDFGYDAGGRVTSITVHDIGEMTIGYDVAGRRSIETGPDGAVTRYRWNDLDQLVGIERAGRDGEVTIVRLELDALGRPQRINGQPVGYDAMTGRPNLLGDVRLISVGDVTWRSDEPAWNRSRDDRPDGVAVAGLVLLGARVFDPLTRQFLTTDPLMAVPGTNGASSAYTYAWHDPVNYFDPSGLQPVSKEAYDAIRQSEEQGSLGKAWETMTDDPWGTLAMGLVAAAGVGLLFVPGGQAIGVGILIGVGTSAAAGLATGTFNPRQVAFSGVLGGVTGGVGSMTSSVTGAVVTGAALGGAGDLGSQMIAGRPVDWQSVAVSTGIGGLTGGLGARLAPATPALTGPTAASIRQNAINGAALGGGGELAHQALTGDGTIDLRTVAIQAAGGGMQGGADHVFGADAPITSEPRVTTASGGESGPPAASAPLAIEAGPPRLAIEAGPTRLAIEAGPTPLAIEAGPTRLAIEAGPPRLAIEAAPPRLAIEAGPTRLALTAGPGG